MAVSVASMAVEDTVRPDDPLGQGIKTEGVTVEAMMSTRVFSSDALLHATGVALKLLEATALELLLVEALAFALGLHAAVDLVSVTLVWVVGLLG